MPLLEQPTYRFVLGYHSIWTFEMQWIYSLKNNLVAYRNWGSNRNHTNGPLVNGKRAGHREKGNKTRLRVLWESTLTRLLHRAIICAEIIAWAAATNYQKTIPETEERGYLRQQRRAVHISCISSLCRMIINGESGQLIKYFREALKSFMTVIFQR